MQDVLVVGCLLVFGRCGQIVFDQILKFYDFGGEVAKVLCGINSICLGELGKDLESAKHEHDGRVSHKIMSCCPVHVQNQGQVVFPVVLRLNIGSKELEKGTVESLNHTITLWVICGCLPLLHIECLQGFR